MSINSEKDLEGLRKIGKVVARCLQFMQTKLEPGITTGELDLLGGQFLEAHGARSAPRLTYNFPGNTCSVLMKKLRMGFRALGFLGLAIW